MRDPFHPSIVNPRAERRSPSKRSHVERPTLRPPSDSCERRAVTKTRCALLTAVRAGLLGLALLGLAGCSDEAGKSQPTGRGTPKCNEWQTAYCDWTSKCRGPATACEAAKATYCKSDQEAARCATGLSSAGCTDPPARCDLRDLADPVPAQKACDAYESAICKHDENCQVNTYDSCLAVLKTALNCTNALGVMRGYEQCMVEVPKIACTATSLPSVCKNILLF
jgi:hypothetical protein